MRRQNRGYTLMELLIVIVLIGIIVGLAIPQLSQGMANTYTSEAANETVLLFRRARTLAVRDRTAMGVNFEATGHAVGLSRGTNNLCTSLPDCSSTPWSGNCAVRELDLNDNRYSRFNIQVRDFTGSFGTNFCVSATGRVMSDVSGTWLPIGGPVEIYINREDGGGNPIGVERTVVVNHLGLARVML